MLKKLEEIKSWFKRDFDEKVKFIHSYKNGERFVAQIKSKNHAYGFIVTSCQDKDEEAEMIITKIFQPCHVYPNGIWTPWTDGPDGKVIFTGSIDEEKWKNAILNICRHEMEDYY